MGEVYKAKDTRLDRTVAIKVLPEHLAESSERKARFAREAKANSQLNHPHICTLYDVGEQDGVDYLVMEYIEGETLAERLKKGALPLEYAVQIADGLDKAHRARIVHRDLKPGNAMLTQSGVKLLDFGLAKLVSDEPVSNLSEAPTKQKELTKEQAIVATLQYMAPEQLEGKSVDARTDIFAFGALLYEMLTGRKAFTGESQASLIAAILDREPPLISSLEPMSPPALEQTIKTCLEKDPEDRWQGAGDLGRQLKIIQGGSQTSETATVVDASVRRDPDESGKCEHGKGERLWPGGELGQPFRIPWMIQSRILPMGVDQDIHFGEEHQRLGGCLAKIASSSSATRALGRSSSISG